MKTILLAVAFFVSSHPLFAQFTNSAQPAKDSTTKHSFLKLGVDYYSDNVYLGRKDVDQQSILMTTAGYFHKSGLYLLAGAGYIPQNGYKRFDVKAFEAGYEHSGDRFYGSVAFARYFFNDSSNAINAYVSSQLQCYADYDLKVATIGTGLDLSFTDGTDVFVSPVISHPFYAAGDHLTVNPQVQMFAGTRNFYQAYFNPAPGKGHSGSNHGNGHGNSGNNGGGTTTGTTTVQLSNEFKIMDYEFSIPIEMKFGNLTLTLNPEYIIPVNAATLEGDNTVTRETLKKLFVMQAGISYKFGHHS